MLRRRSQRRGPFETGIRLTKFAGRGSPYDSPGSPRGEGIAALPTTRVIHFSDPPSLLANAHVPRTRDEVAPEGARQWAASCRARRVAMDSKCAGKPPPPLRGPARVPHHARRCAAFSGLPSALAGGRVPAGAADPVRRPAIGERGPVRHAVPTADCHRGAQSDAPSHRDTRSESVSASPRTPAGGFPTRRLPVVALHTGGRLGPVGYAYAAAVATVPAVAESGSPRPSC